MRPGGVSAPPRGPRFSPAFLPRPCPALASRRPEQPGTRGTAQGCRLHRVGRWAWAGRRHTGWGGGGGGRGHSDPEKVASVWGTPATRPTPSCPEGGSGPGQQTPGMEKGAQEGSPDSRLPSVQKGACGTDPHIWVALDGVQGNPVRKGASLKPHNSCKTQRRTVGDRAPDKDPSRHLFGREENCRTLTTKGTSLIPQKTRVKAARQGTDPEETRATYASSGGVTSRAQRQTTRTVQVGTPPALPPRRSSAAKGAGDKTLGVSRHQENRELSQGTSPDWSEAGHSECWQGHGHRGNRPLRLGNGDGLSKGYSSST